MWQYVKPMLTYGVTFFAGLFAGGMLMQRAIKKSMSKMMGGMDPQQMAALTQQMGGQNPLAGMDPQTMQALNQQLANMDPKTLEAINQQISSMDPQQLNAMAAKMGLPPITAGNQLNVMSPSTIPVPQNNIPTANMPVNRANIMPMNLTASQLGTGGSMRI